MSEPRDHDEPTPAEQRAAIRDARRREWITHCRTVITQARDRKQPTEPPPQPDNP